jgi:hypothetical protein
MTVYTEEYKGHEIQLTGTGKGWNYQIPKILGLRPSMLYSKKETALQIAKGVIDNFITL